MSVAYSLTGDYTIRYRLQIAPEQVKLQLWEPPVVTNQESAPPAPYLYLANFTFGTVTEAEAYLRNYLLKNGAFDLPETNFPAEGEVAILPYPTWGRDPL